MSSPTVVSASSLFKVILVVKTIAARQCKFTGEQIVADTTKIQWNMNTKLIYCTKQYNTYSEINVDGNDGMVPTSELIDPSLYLRGCEQIKSNQKIIISTWCAYRWNNCEGKFGNVPCIALSTKLLHKNCDESARFFIVRQYAYKKVRPDNNVNSSGNVPVKFDRNSTRCTTRPALSHFKKGVLKPR
jgi:hypothetical protein